jgi:signal transduction histidine kinase
LWHTLELAGFGVIAYAVLGAYRRGQTGESLLESLFLSGTRARLQADYAKAMDALVETLSRGEKPIPELRRALRERFGMVEGQMQALEHAAAAVAQERQQRRELERLNAALHQLEQDKSQLMQMVVHDLKNPLTALVGFLELLRLDRLSEEQCLLVESALRSGKNLSGLISDLLDVGRIEEGHMELERTLLPPRDLLEDCASEMRGWIIQDDKQILIETPDDLPLLQADLRLMHRVILNLISNAIKHTPAGTSIILRAYQATTHEQEPKGQLVIEVADDGPGIPPEYLDRIFDKYGRVNGDHHPRQDSTGLGLTFCRLAIEAHEGSIGVSSVLGQGTTFHLRLPAV